MFLGNTEIQEKVTCKLQHMNPRKEGYSNLILIKNMTENKTLENIKIFYRFLKC